MLLNRNPEYFLTIVRERNISRAAGKLYISQSSLSQHIAKLEEGLGAQLLDRTRTPLTLTPAGELYRNYLESSSFLYDKFMVDLTELNRSRMQTVHLGLGTWRGEMLSPVVVPSFLQEHPQTRIDLHEFPVSELYPLMEDGKVDFSIMNTAPSGVPEGFVNEVIAYERILLVVNRESQLAAKLAQSQPAGQMPDLRLLEQERYISLSNTLIVGRHVGNFIQKNRLTFLDRLNTTNNTTILRLVDARMGFCFMVETGVADAAHYPDLQLIDLHSPDLSIPLSIVHKSNCYLSPLAQDFMETIRTYYRQLIKKTTGSQL